MTIAAIVFVACRLFANRKEMWWSDHFILVAFILSLVETGLMLAQTKFARHQWDVRACWYNGTYNKSSGGRNVASVLFTDRPQKELIWGVVQAALGIVLDLFIFILPIPVILRLKLSRRKQIQILIVFSTASMGVIAGVLSLVYRLEALNTNDVTWKYTLVLIFCLLENQITIIVSCTVGFVNFVTVYISELAIIRSLRSSLGSGNRSSTHFKLDPNQPRPGRGPRRNENHELDMVSDSLTSLTEMGEDQSLPSVCDSSAAGVSQETHYPEFKHVTDFKEFKLPEYPPRVINYGTSWAHPANYIWSHGGPSSRKHGVRPGNMSDHGHTTYLSVNISTHTSAERLV
ncbi:predicted protein [Sclerotinia sclerotiorum 1980 UF-70]|uniref:Rhodopsin domain-containing protein n=1 Tax=Sclerotinia sclerotiorum (strain ATCC 18683 / 1980 / Ss-1) TaxID=665079 RepID=A7EFJ8_SCLS1|nr:predicted protein [Sclerotinia sclerotiorum 1980 UF-70]EDO01614.1 predicted protein [Sclerotinia sclerotiorum 1980 UF-70]